MDRTSLRASKKEQASHARGAFRLRGLLVDSQNAACFPNLNFAEEHIGYVGYTWVLTETNS